MVILRRSNGYSKVDKEDPEEIIHRRAQFLIHKVLERADCRRKPSFLRIRLCRLKVKIGRRLKKLRKSALVSISAARTGVYKQVIDQLKTWRRLFNPASHHGTIATLPRPLLT
ncbi:hypothetical protein ERO13_A05G169600v2 [Gossypium hirsutum]|uniref:Uncharacterized protein n=5 Tax=Gossypium TaxID=3633 RepID=A0ABR0PWS3_GOSAR|nr:uncharacterized protein LOC107958266 [Gossypium hirsutum]XP_017605573.1 uncharacterized protein LOC108452310 [Gossypium arboreum]PPR99548.1 hypothetical protein GOBAR_AA21114 [Gossypium barbadense]TYH17306.1 hypothetical protein ES288_A05G181800v1 [Gossypium darwinii]TYI27540.1 hypothetical protein ES332_A05G184200v1 [Gossypium tomentosum]KAG4199807.1 hypothetical protein ERO13_A05G169600v2 [Gossypium hirsutum]KAK5831480.1 hypothetical protein PVK06_015278 [Gossypium arboreum]